MPKKAVWQGIFVFFLDILIAMVFDAGSARAEGSAARFQGIVTSLTGQPLTGASVILVAWPGGKEPIARVSTGEDGRFTIEGPAGARVEVVASMEGYCAYRITDVILGAGDQPQAAIALQRGVRVDGAVRAAQGSPVGGATVRVDLFRLRPSGLRKGSESEGSLSSGRAEVKTSEDGSFSLGVLPVADGYLLEVRHPGYPPHDLRLDLTGRASPAQIAIKLPAPAEIRGLVVGKDGSPVAGAMTRAIDLSRSAPTEEEPREASTSDEGVFRVGPLAPGRYRLEIRPPEGLREILGPIDVAAGASVDVGRIVVRPGVAIDGTVVDRRGDPVAGATVKAFRQLQNGRSLERVTRTGEDGRFRAAGLAEGFYTVRVEPKEPHLSQETEDIEAPATGISLEVGTEAVITGTVVDRNGAPLAKLRVWASASNPRSRYDNMGRAEIVDRESGAFRIRGLREGEVIVSARADRRSPVHSEPMYVEAGGSYGPLNLVLEPGHTIEGRVFDRTTGAGIGGAAVSLAADGDVGAITSRDGRFSLEGLRPGQASLSVEHPSYAPTQVNAVISPDEARLLDIPLEPGAELIVSVRTAQGAPAEAVSISVKAPGGVQRSALTGPDGTCRFEHLPAGKADVTRSGGGRSPIDDIDSRVVALDETTPAKIEFVLGGRVEGIVTRSGSPVAGLRLTLAGALASPVGEEGQSYAARSTWSDAAGHFRVDGVSPGRKTLTLADDRQITTRIVDVPDTPNHWLDIALPSRPLMVEVVAAKDGSPAAGALVEASPHAGRRAANWSIKRSTQVTGGEGYLLHLGGSDGERSTASVNGRVTLFVDKERAYELWGWDQRAGNGSASVDAGTEPRHIRLELTQKARLSGKVLGPAGEAVAGAAVCVIHRNRTSCSSGMTGQYEFPQVDSGPATIIAAAPGLALQVKEIADLRAEGEGGPNMVDFTLGPEGLLDVKLPEDPPALQVVELRGADGKNILTWLRMLGRISISGEGKTSMTRIASIPPGEYFVFVGSGKEGALTRPIPATVRAGKTTEVAAP